mmetsp:Transcript_50491/g.90641  ORF Transcript_50491/g.90641 Transcript_50491/m.90641 type:complete len:252 (+) Transcript_50491:71-826(+)
MPTGVVTSYNPHKGWGFIECNGQDVFVNKRECGGFCLAKGMQVEFGLAQGEKGSHATGVRVLVAPEEALYHGEIKSFNMSKGFGFIGCEAFPGQDVFLFKSAVYGGFVPEGGLCKFKATMEEKGPAATDVQLLGDTKGYGKGDMWGFGMWGKGFGKGKGKSKGGPRVDPSLKVWIGNLPEGSRWKDLQEHMEKAGKTKWCEVFEGKGKGTGTVAYTSTEDVATAISTLNGSIFAGASIQVDPWVKAPREEA